MLQDPYPSTHTLTHACIHTCTHYSRQQPSQSIISNLLERAQTLLSHSGYYLFPLSGNQVTREGTLSFQKVLNKEWRSYFGPRNSGSLNNSCLKCTNKTLHIKGWQSEGWAQTWLLKFLLEKLERRLTLLVFLSQRVISPKTLLAAKSCQKCSLSTTLWPLLLRTAVPWESTFAQLCCGKHQEKDFSQICSNWATGSHTHKLPCLCYSL